MEAEDWFADVPARDPRQFQSSESPNIAYSEEWMVQLEAEMRARLKEQEEIKALPVSDGEFELRAALAGAQTIARNRKLPMAVRRAQIKALLKPHFMK